MNDETLLVLIVPARRRDDVADVLLGFAAISGFSASDAAGFSRAHSHFDLHEQVQGYGNYQRFEVLCDARTRAELLIELASVAGRDHWRYWVLPVVETGTIGA